MTRLPVMSSIITATYEVGDSEMAKPQPGFMKNTSCIALAIA